MQIIKVVIGLLSFSVIVIYTSLIVFGEILYGNAYKGIVVEVDDKTLSSHCGFKYKSMEENPQYFGIHCLYASKFENPTPDSLAQFANCYFKQYKQVGKLLFFISYYKFPSEAQAYGKYVYEIEKDSTGIVAINITKRGHWAFARYQCSSGTDSCTRKK
jgi:hypothetical protein